MKPLARGSPPLRVLFAVAGVLAFGGCESSPRSAAHLVAQQPIATADFAALIERVSEPGGYFDTDNLISNESGYLNVIDALDRAGLSGGAFIGVGPDQSFSYIAAIRPEIAFITDVRRDNLLHHLLLKSLIERSATRIELVASLHGVEPPDDAVAWRERDVERIVAWVDSAWAGRGADDQAWVVRLQDELQASIMAYGLSLDEGDFETIRRFHDTFIRAGLGLRFTSFGRSPRSYYPTHRQLVLETDADGDRASYLATPGAYETVRSLQLANRIVPVVGDLSGPHALREIGAVMREMDVELTAFYASNVEFYLWRDGTFREWTANLRALPRSDDAVVIRSYFPNFGRDHPSALPGYYATQALQDVSTLITSDFTSYWGVVTRETHPLR